MPYPLLAAAAPYVAAAVGAAGSIFSGKSANKASKKSAREQMKFQEEMSNTAHQREVKDLRAAGLNPILSANTGASTPSGASYTAQEIDAVGGAQKGFATAKEAKRMNPEIEVMKKQAQSLESSAKAVDKQAEKTDKEIKEKLPIEIAALQSQNENTLQSTAKMQADMATSRLQNDRQKIENEALQYDLDAMKTIPPEYRAGAKIFQSFLESSFSGAKDVKAIMEKGESISTTHKGPGGSQTHTKRR